MSPLNKIIQALIFEVGVNAVISLSISEFPFLGLPVISTLYRFAVNKIANTIYASLSQFVAFQVIDFQTKAEQDKYNAAVENLRLAYLNGEDQNAINQAIDNFRNALRDIVSFKLQESRA